MRVTWGWGGPVHGPDICNSETRRTSCPSCKQSVFFFFCDHGSRVYFDRLGHPWPLHTCGRSRHRPPRPKTVDPRVGRRKTVFGYVAEVRRPRGAALSEGRGPGAVTLSEGQLARLGSLAAEPHGQITMVSDDGTEKVTAYAPARLLEFHGEEARVVAELEGRHNRPYDFRFWHCFSLITSG